jgi:hypothetical protein
MSAVLNGGTVATRALVFLLFCASCAGDREISHPSDIPEVRTHLVSGVIADSILGLPLASIRVLIGDSSTLTDSLGRFTTRHAAGVVAIAVGDVSYEAYQLPLQLFADKGMVQIQLRGQAPYVTSCLFDVDELTATVIDLQGRKTINRRSQTTMSLVASGESFRRDANSWSWTPIDDLTWLAHVPLAGVHADSAVWRLEDADGHWRTARCVNRPPPCHNCTPRP